MCGVLKNEKIVTGNSNFVTDVAVETKEPWQNLVDAEKKIEKFEIFKGMKSK